MRILTSFRHPNTFTTPFNNFTRLKGKIWNLFVKRPCYNLQNFLNKHVKSLNPCLLSSLRWNVTYSRILSCFEAILWTKVPKQFCLLRGLFRFIFMVIEAQTKNAKGIKIYRILRISYRGFVDLINYDWYLMSSCWIPTLNMYEKTLRRCVY